MTGDRPDEVALVTGAAGFIGRRLCAGLHERGWAVRALLRRESEGPWEVAWKGDLMGEAPPVNAFRDVDCVFHLAARTHAIDEGGDDEAVYASINVEGTRRIVEAARVAGVRRVVHFSSIKTMGEGGGARLDETATPVPVTAYGRTKLAAERIVLDAAATGGPEGTVLRLPLVYGPGVRGNLARMIETAERGRLPPLPECGNRRSLVHVDDVVEAAIAACGTPAAAGQVYLLTDGCEYSTRALYELTCRALGRAPARWSVPIGLLRAGAAAGDVLGRIAGRRMPLDRAALDRLLGSACYDDAKARRDLDWAPRHTLAETLPAMVAQMRTTRTGRAHGVGASGTRTHTP